MSGRKLYFVAYNTVMATAWFWILLVTLFTSLSPSKGPSKVHEEAGWLVQAAQTAALMELVHIVAGVTRAPFLSSLAQLAGRLFCVWGVVAAVPEVRPSPWVALLLLCWSLADALRYLFFAWKEATGAPPYVLLWLRYSLFLVLYPPGMLSELALAFLALPIIKARRIGYIDMPNAVNFAVDYYFLTCALLSLYIPGAPFMYSYMLKQRAKMLYPHKNE